MFASWNARALGLSSAAEETITVAAAAGFPGVDLMVRDLVDAGARPRALRARMDDLGLRGGSWTLPVNWRGPAERFAADLDVLPRYAEAADTLGLRRTGTWILPEIHAEFLETQNPEDAVRRTFTLHLQRLGAIAHILAEHGIAFGLEIMGPAGARDGRNPAFIHRYRDLGPLLCALRENHDNVGVLVDSFHLYGAGEETREGLTWGAAAVTAVHIADPIQADRMTLADHQRELPSPAGLGDCAGLLRALRDEGYQGPVIAEPLGRCRSLQGLNTSLAAARTRAALRSVWPS
jgi:sugar phosphate isomerase/epimerase